MLTTRHVEDPDITKAAVELMANARLLVIAGRFGEAFEALAGLLEEGPWKAKAHGRHRQELERLFPIVCYLARRACPGIGGVPAMSKAELVEWARQEEERFLDLLAMPVRHLDAPAGARWNDDFFASLVATGDRSSKLRAFGDFSMDAESVLKARLAEGRPANFFGAFVGDIRAALQSVGVPEDSSALEWIKRSARPPEVAPGARHVPEMKIATIASQFSWGEPDYLLTFILQAAIVLRLRAGAVRDAVECVRLLIASGESPQAVVNMGVCELVEDALRTGAFAGVAGVDVEPAALAAFLEALKARKGGAETPARAASRRSADSLDTFSTVIASSVLRGREIAELPVTETGERAYAIAITARELEPTWLAARALVARTGRWPVAAIYYGEAGGALDQRLIDEDLFSRFYFEEAPDCDDVSPAALIAASDAVNIDEFLRRKREARDEESGRGIDEVLEYHLEDTKRRCGEAPTRQDASKARIEGKPLTSVWHVERWLFEWEQAHGRPGATRAFREWFEPDQLVLVFLPTANSWDSVAYINMFGTSDYGAQNYIALLRRWHERYGAELVANYGTMLQFLVSRPPATAEDAFTLAGEQYLAAPCTLDLSGTTVREHAAGLIGDDRWFLHERP